MFDYIYYNCPHCNKRIEDQSKAGDCNLNQYDLENAPPEVLRSVTGDHTCPACDEVFTIESTIKTSYRIGKA